MPLTDKDRIAHDQSTPRIIELWKALTALKSVVSFMNTGAHPDDETSAMLAALRFRDGVDISYACSTRGEGGQNDIGSETSQALGVLRTAEMEAACDRLDLRMYWLSENPDDTISDFGFSKSGKETLSKWDRTRTLARFVHIIRRERPDMICPTFLDVPGQHGHHRAMTEAAHAVMDLAADKSYDGCDLPPWEIQKMYLPAWSGAGQAYDDDLPPPPATLTVKATDSDPVTGWSFARIGQQSRAEHATQAMGRWIKRGTETDFPLHLVRSRTGEPDSSITSGLATKLSDLPIPEATEYLVKTQECIDAAVAAFPDQTKVLAFATGALSSLEKAYSTMSETSTAAFGHKLDRKRLQLAQVIRISANVEVSGMFERDILRPSESVGIKIDHHPADVAVTPLLPTGWTIDGSTITLDETASPSDPYPDTYLPDAPATPCLEVTVDAMGTRSTTRIPFETTPLVVPTRSATLSPVADVINTAAENRSVTVRLDDVGPQDADTCLKAPPGWKVSQSGKTISAKAPADVRPGLYTLVLEIDGVPAQSVRHIQRNADAHRALVHPAEVQIRVIEAQLPDVKVGYIGGGNDRVAHWLNRIGVDVTDLSNHELSAETLADYDTLVVGIFAMKFCKGLADAMPRIHDWTRRGGTLVTLYHRPWDNWNPDAIPPHRLEIGQPSLRWRVTNEASEVTLLQPDHPLLHTPNEITEADWSDWHKERGLYFAKSWDAAYKPLISMHDPDEAPLEGAWLVADVGKGRHIHTSLILHHQMDKLTSGAFRIMANLLVRKS